MPANPTCSTKPPPVQPIGVLAVVLVLAVSLQGCSFGTASPSTTWKTQTSYQMTYKFVAPGTATADGVLNSCEVKGINPKLRCNGNGVCQAWNTSASDALSVPISFCECYRDWADPECRTKRKSQAHAFWLSVFFGAFGADHFYLGDWEQGLSKLCTIGGLGLWWVIDIVRIGSGPVYAGNFRVAPDLPHGTYVSLTTLFFALVGYLIFGLRAKVVRSQRQKSKMLLQAETTFYREHDRDIGIDPMDTIGMPIRSQIGIPMPCGVPDSYGALDQRMVAAGRHNPFSSYTAMQDKMNYATATSTQGMFIP